MTGWNHEGAFKEKPCVVCEGMFKPKSGVNKFCTPQCKGKWQYITGRMSSDNQYKYISGDWRRYFARLRQRSHRRTVLLLADLLRLRERQNGMCALTGVEMTCELKMGQRTWTNASIDRIEAGGPYTLDNVHLVCHAVNLFRSNLPLEEYVEWCRKVANYRKG